MSYLFFLIGFLFSMASPANDRSLCTMVRPVVGPTVSFFDKKIDLSRLRSIMGISFEQSLLALAKENLDVYRTKELPQELFTLWQESSHEEGGLSGLYIPLWKIKNKGFDRPVIIISEGADQWTLLHEYSHFLFDQQREEDLIHESEIVLKFQGSLEEFEAVSEQVDSQRDFVFVQPNDETSRLRLQIKTWLQTTDSYLGLLQNYTLEEIAIEENLREFFLRGELGFFTSKSEIAAKNFLRVKTQSAVQLLKYRLEEADEVEIKMLLLAQKGKNVFSENQKREELRQKIDRWRLQLEQIQNHLDF